jgi:uncharacterized protein YodC (DUF2158 family)
MLMHKFKEGDRVQLKTGGPVMTVHSVPGNPSIRYVNCQWHEDKKLREARFLPGSLEYANKKGKAAG